MALGGCAGFLVGRLPQRVVLRSLCRSLALKTSDELHSFLHDPDCPIPNLVLLELQRRGEDLRSELGAILNLLVSGDVARRARGLAAMAAAFPHLGGLAADYHLDDSVADCRRITEGLQSVAADSAKPPAGQV